jgi:predicted phosphohydrolase
VSAGAEEDWRDMWRLSYALIFEALKLVLLISLMIVRLGTVAIEGVRRWLDKGMPRVLDLGHKESWIDAKEM